MIPSSPSVSRFAFGEPNRFRLRSSQTFTPEAALAKAILVNRSSCWALKGASTGAQCLNLLASTGRSELLLSEAGHGRVSPRPILSRLAERSSCLACLRSKQAEGQLSLRLSKTASASLTGLYKPEVCKRRRTISFTPEGADLARTAERSSISEADRPRLGRRPAVLVPRRG